MKTRNLIFASVLFAMASFFSVSCENGVNTKSSLNREIAALQSSDFRTVRKAQLAIRSSGTAALNELFVTMRSSTNEQQLSLCCYLIGTIDAEAYKKALIEFAAPGRISVVLHYPNKEAIDSMSEQQRQELFAHFNSISNSLTEAESARIGAVTNPK